MLGLYGRNIHLVWLISIAGVKIVHFDHTSNIPSNPMFDLKGMEGGRTEYEDVDFSSCRIPGGDPDLSATTRQSWIKQYKLRVGV